MSNNIDNITHFFKKKDMNKSQVKLELDIHHDKKVE